MDGMLLKKDINAFNPLAHSFNEPSLGRTDE